MNSGTKESKGQGKQGKTGSPVVSTDATAKEEQRKSDLAKTLETNVQNKENLPAMGKEIKPAGDMFSEFMKRHQRWCQNICRRSASCV